MQKRSINIVRMMIRVALVALGVAVGIFIDRMIAPGLTRDAMSILALLVLVTIAFALVLLVGILLGARAGANAPLNATRLDSGELVSDIIGIQSASALVPSLTVPPNPIRRVAQRFAAWNRSRRAQQESQENLVVLGDEDRKMPPTAAMLFIFGLGLALIGQIILSVDEHSANWGLVVVGAAYVLIFAALRAASRTTAGRFDARLGTLRLTRTTLGQIGLALAAVAAIIFCTFASQGPRPDDNYWVTFYAWLAAIAALTIAFVLIPAWGSWKGLRARLWRSRATILIVGVLTLLAFALRAYDIVNIPFPFGGDEGSIGQEAIRILNGEVSNMFRSGWSSEASLSFLVWAVSVRIFGDSIFGIRILAVIFGTLTIPTSYLMARAMFNKPIALLTATALAVMALHIHFSRQVLNNVEAPLFAALSFGIIYRAVQTRKLYWFAAGGIVAGLSVYSYAGSRLVLLLAGAWLLIQFVFDKKRWQEWHKYALFVVCATLVVLPIAYYFAMHLDIGFSRMNQMGAFQTGWVEREVEATGEPIPLIVFRNMVRTLLMFVSIPAIHGFYNSPQPLFDGMWAFLLAIGLALSMFAVRQGRHLLLQMWFWSVVFFGGALIIPPPAAERMVILLPAVAVFVALALWKLAAFCGDLLNWKPLVRAGAIAVAVTVLAFLSLSFYFWEYTPKYYFTSANDEVALDLGLYMGEAPRNSIVYFAGQPRMFIGFPSIPYLSHNLKGFDFTDVNELDELVKRGRPAIFAATPDHKRLMQRIRDKYPGGDYQEIWRVTNPGEMLYLRYTVTLD